MGRSIHSRLPIASIATHLPIAVLRVIAELSKIVFGVLEVTFGSDSVAGQRCIPRERQIFLEHLLDSASNLDVGAIAFERLVFRDKALAESEGA